MRNLKSIAIGQAGGPTSVLNASLVGFLNTIKDSKIYGVISGFQGLVENNIFLMDSKILAEANKFKNIPGAYLGSGRYHLKEDDFTKIISNLKKSGINTLVFSGGNGTMWTLNKIHQTAQKLHYPLQVIGIPKTVDNDMAETDHAPGFGSAARYISHAVRDISIDLESMQNFEQVRLIETMGRNVGWLAASSGLLKERSTDGPHKIYVPEIPITVEGILKDISGVIQQNGYATIVISEGIILDGGSNITIGKFNGRKVLGGVSSHLAEIIQRELGLKSRSEILGMHQRSSQAYISLQDQKEAYEVGMKAAELVFRDESGVMISIIRGEGKTYSFFLSCVPLEKVAKGGERRLPKKFYDFDKYNDWVRPLVGEGLQSFPPSLIGRSKSENGEITTR